MDTPDSRFDHGSPGGELVPKSVNHNYLLSIANDPVSLDAGGFISITSKLFILNKILLMVPSLFSIAVVAYFSPDFLSLMYLCERKKAV